MKAGIQQECIHQYFLENNNVKKTTLFNFSSFDSSIYEVIRIIKGIPLFMEDHYYRLKNSALLLQYPFIISEKDLTEMVSKTIDANNVKTGNIKIVILYKDLSNPVYLSYFIQHYYPSDNEFNSGVKLGIFHTERPIPNAKILRTEYIAQIDSYKKAINAFEVILCDRDKNMTEGSKSNLFFIKNDTIYTPPAFQILEGITRKYIFRICREKEINLIEEKIQQTQLPAFESVFITGTSNKVLPVNKIDNIPYTINHPILQLLKSEYDLLVNDYIKNKLSKPC